SWGHYGAQPSLQWGVKPTVPTSHWEHQSSWLTSSANHLVRQDEDHRGDGDPQGLGGLEVNAAFELHGLLHGQVPWLRPFENLVHVGGGASVPLLQTDAIGHEA